MKVANLRALGLIAWFLCFSTAQAAVVETTYTGWDEFCCEPHFEIRYGGASDWEIGAKNPGVVSTAQHDTWVDGIAQAFTLSHDSASGDLTFTIGGSAPMTLDLVPATAWNKISIMAKTSTSEAQYVVTIDNLVFNSGEADQYAIANVPLVASAGSKDGVFITQDTLTPFADFSIDGELTFSWGATSPAGSHLEMFIGVAGQEAVIPVPAAIWLLGSALAFLGTQRRRHAV